MTTLLETTVQEFILSEEPSVTTVELPGGEVLVVADEVINLVSEAVQGPPGPRGPIGDMTSDPLAFYILAKS